MQLLQGAPEHFLDLPELFRGATDIIFLLQRVTYLELIHLVYVEFSVNFVVFTLEHHSVEQVVLVVLYALLHFFELCGQSSSYHVVFAVELRVETQELGEDVTVVLLLVDFVEVLVDLEVLEEAYDEHEETVGAQTSVSGLIQAIDLKHLLENEHEGAEHGKLFFKSSDHLDDFVASVLQVILWVPVVYHVSHVNLEILLVDLFVLLADFDTLLARKLNQRARHVHNWPPRINIVKIFQPLGFFVVFFSLQLIFNVLQGLQVIPRVEINVALDA